MADNITLNAGSGGSTLATDDVSGVQYQRVKPAYGDYGSANDVSPSYPLPAVTPHLPTQSITVTAGSGSRTFGPIDLSGWSNWVATWTAVGSAAGNMVLKFSPDQTNWYAFPMDVIYNSISQTMSRTDALYNQTSTGTMLFAPTYFRYARIETTGTVTGTYTLLFNNLQVHPRNYQATSVVGTIGSGFDATSNAGIGALAMGYGFAGSFIGWDRLRVPTVVKQVTATASGTTSIWTPSNSSLKFRLMRYRIQCPGNTTTGSAGQLTVQFYDAASAMPIVEQIYLPASAFAGGYTTPWIDLGHGVKSATANNALGVNLSAAITAGGIQVLVCGTEET